MRKAKLPTAVLVLIIIALSLIYCEKDEYYTKAQVDAYLRDYAEIDSVTTDALSIVSVSLAATVEIVSLMDTKFDDISTRLDSLQLMVDTLAMPSDPVMRPVMIGDSTFTVEWNHDQPETVRYYTVRIYCEWGQYDSLNTTLLYQPYRSEWFMKDISHWVNVTASNQAGTSQPSESVQFVVK